MEKAFQQRRRQIVDDCHQLRLDAWRQQLRHQSDPERQAWHQSKIWRRRSPAHSISECANAYTLVHSADQRLFKESREPRIFRGAICRVLQFRPIHKTLRTTPAMAAKVTSRLWEIGDIVDVLEAWDSA